MQALIQNNIVQTYPYSFKQLKQDNPQVSFPAAPSEACLAEWGVFTVANTQMPTVDHTKVVSEAPVASLDDKWVQVWVVRDATEDELIGRTAEKSVAIRAERGIALAATDWTQVSDAPVDQAAWAIYRQALRDITTQQDFPWGIIWPVAPV
jgi:hypothetical protein